jgi:hypothetical protein
MLNLYCQRNFAIPYIMDQLSFDLEQLFRSIHLYITYAHKGAFHQVEQKRKGYHTIDGFFSQFILVYFFILVPEALEKRKCSSFIM